MTDAGNPSAVLRRERAQRAVARLADEVGRWAAGWAGASAQTSQLERVGKTLRALLDRLRGRAAKLAGATLFADARKLDADLVVTERLWRHFAERFEQRRDPTLAATLRAADDVIWACTAEARALAAGEGRAPMPLPLAYVEPAFTPSAIPRSEPPAELRPSDAALARIVAFLPVPLIGLPTSVVDEPWWLVLLAHEVGHHVHYDLEPAAALVGRTSDLLAEAGGVEGEVWRGWSHEVFADAFAVATAGEAAIAAAADLEWDDAAAMVAERGGYPPVLIRGAIMAELAIRLKLRPAGDARGDALVQSLDPAVRELVRARLGGAARAAAALAGMRIAGGTLATISARVRGADDGFLDELLGGEPLSLDPGRLQPLRIAAAAYRAYRALAVLPDEAARDDGRRRLRAQVAPLIAALGEGPNTLREGTRGADADAEAEALSVEVEALLPSRLAAGAPPLAAEVRP